MPVLRKFHIVLTSGEERDGTGKEAKVRDGALVITNNSEEAVIYAAGQWVMCELERKDDRG
jgi:hypothetical protein